MAGDCGKVRGMALSFQYDEAKLIADYFARVPRPSDRPGVLIDVGAQFGTSFRPYSRPVGNALCLSLIRPSWPSSSGFCRAPTSPSSVPPSATRRRSRPSSISTGISSLVAFRDTHTPLETVPVTTLKIELPKLGITHIDYLKIDTEGYDLFVLRGHDWSIQPEVVMAEFDDVKTRHIDISYRDIADLLVEQGYTVFCSEWAPLIRYGSGHTWYALKRYPCDLHHPNAWGNFIAIRNDADIAAMEALAAPIWRRRATRAGRQKESFSRFSRAI